MISPRFAQQMAKVTDSADKVSGISGELKKVYQTDELTLRFGNFEQRRERLLAFDLENISEDSETKVSGLLGFAMFWILDMKLDYRDHLVDFQLDPSRLH
jgi:hypothetical protein